MPFSIKGVAWGVFSGDVAVSGCADREATFFVQVWKCRWLGLDSKLCVAGDGLRGSLHVGWFKASCTAASENDLQR